MLNGCDDRILCLQWHPNLQHILATGAFDNVIRVHDTEFDGFKELVYHQDRVRSVQWSTEIPWLLASGGDDSI